MRKPDPSPGRPENQRGWLPCALRERFRSGYAPGTQPAWSPAMRAARCTGGMAERFKAHAWRACSPIGVVGSNPTPSATRRGLAAATGEGSLNHWRRRAGSCQRGPVRDVLIAARIALERLNLERRQAGGAGERSAEISRTIESRRFRDSRSLSGSDVRRRNGCCFSRDVPSDSCGRPTSATRRPCQRPCSRRICDRSA